MMGYEASPKWDDDRAPGARDANILDAAFIFSTLHLTGGELTS